jgi:hypothetical protein
MHESVARCRVQSRSREHGHTAASIGLSKYKVQFRHKEIDIRDTELSLCSRLLGSRKDVKQRRRTILMTCAVVGVSGKRDGLADLDSRMERVAQNRRD